MERSRLWNTLLVLLILIAALVLAQMLWQLLSGFADIILLFILGWILSFVLDPAVDDLSLHPVPLILLDIFNPLLGEQRTQKLENFRLSRPAAVIVVYLGLLLLVIVGVALFLPPTVVQLTQLGSHLPEYMARLPAAGGWLEEQLGHFGIRLNIEDTVRGALTGLQGAATMLVQNALGIFASLLAFLANLFFVLILSFYISLDGSRVRHMIFDLVPENYQREAHYLSQSVNRTFGGFIRGQFFQAALQGAGTAVAMSVLGLNFVLAASLFAVLFMLIPLVGSVLALIPPMLVVLLQAPELAIWLLLALFIYQFIIVNVLMPRVFSQALGLHPLLIFAAILVGIKVGGFWGAFFGIPIAGVIWAMVVFVFEEWQRDYAVRTGEAFPWTGTERRHEPERRHVAPSRAGEEQAGAGPRGTPARDKQP